MELRPSAMSLATIFCASGFPRIVDWKPLCGTRVSGHVGVRKRRTHGLGKLPRLLVPERYWWRNWPRQTKPPKRLSQRA